MVAGWIAGGTHGSAISAATGQGFTDDGRNGLAIAYDLKTLKITKRIPADKDADAIAFDRASGHVFVIEGDDDGSTPGPSLRLRVSVRMIPATTCTVGPSRPIEPPQSRGATVSTTFQSAVGKVTR